MSDPRKKLYTGIIGDAGIPEAPEDDRLVQETIREAGIVKVEDGVEYDPQSLKAQRWIEGRFDSPTTLYDENVPPSYWQGLAGYMKPIIRHTSDPRLREIRDVCWRFAKILQGQKSRIITPMKSQLELNDTLVSAMCANVRTMREFVDAKERVGEALRFWVEMNYRYFNDRYMGRKVG